MCSVDSFDVRLLRPSLFGEYAINNRVVSRFLAGNFNYRKGPIRVECHHQVVHDDF